jgi:hypothetical protein
VAASALSAESSGSKARSSNKAAGKKQGSCSSLSKGKEPEPVDHFYYYPKLDSKVISRKGYLTSPLNLNLIA